MGHHIQRVSRRWWRQAVMEDWEGRLKKQTKGYLKSCYPTLFIVTIKASKGFSGQKRWQERRDAHHLQGSSSATTITVYQSNSLLTWSNWFPPLFPYVGGGGDRPGIHNLHWGDGSFPSQPLLVHSVLLDAAQPGAQLHVWDHAGNPHTAHG